MTSCRMVWPTLLGILPAWLGAQPFDAIPPGTYPVVIGAGQFFFALIVGVLLALAFQRALDALAVTAGVRASGGFAHGDKTNDAGFKKHHEESEARPAGRNEMLALKSDTELLGIWSAITTSIALFFACWLAASLLRLGTHRESVVLGLAVWAGFLVSLIASKRLSADSLIGALLGLFRSGNHAALKPARSLASYLGVIKPPSREAVAAAVRAEYALRESGKAVPQHLHEYLDKMRPRFLDQSAIESEVKVLFGDPEIRDQARQGLLHPADRRKLREIASGRTDFSMTETTELAEVLHSHWNKVLSDEKQALIARAAGNVAPAPSADTVHEGGYASPEVGLPASEQPSAERGSGEETVGVPRESPAAAGAAAENATEITSKNQGSAMGSEAGATAANAPGGGKPVRGMAARPHADRYQSFRDFLRGCDKRELNPARLELEVKALVHPEEGRAGAERGAKELNRSDLSLLLRKRRDLSQQDADAIAGLIDSVRTRMRSQSEMREHRIHESTDRTIAKVRDFVYSLRRIELDYDGFKRDFARILGDPAEGLSVLTARIDGLDHDALIELFAARRELARDESEKLARVALEAKREILEAAAKIEAEVNERLGEATRKARDRMEVAQRLSAAAVGWTLAVAAASAVGAALGGYAGARM